MLERAVSLVMAGNLHRVPKHMQRGFSAPFSTSAAGYFLFFYFFGFPGVEARRRLSSGPSGRLSVNAADTLGAITRIFVTRCESSVKSFPLGCKNRRWAWRSEPLQTAVCSSHRSVSRSQRNASVGVCVFGPRADSVTNTNSPNALHCPSLCAFVETNYGSGK